MKGLLLLVASWLLLSASSWGAPVASPQQRAVAPAARQPQGVDPGASSAQVPPQLREVRFRPAPDARVPLELPLVDSSGTPVSLRELLVRPAVLVPVYHECPMLCSLMTDGLLRALAGLSLQPGRDFDVLVWSIDPAEGPALAAQARERFLARLDRPGAGQGVRFLTGEQQALSRLAEAVGFAAVRDPASGEWAHAAGVLVLTADGRVARFLAGVDVPARDLHLALLEAGEGRVTGLIDRAFLFCFRYDPSAARYSAAVLRMVRAGGVLTLGALLLGALFLSRRRARAVGRA